MYKVVYNSFLIFDPKQKHIGVKKSAASGRNLDNTVYTLSDNALLTTKSFVTMPPAPSPGNSGDIDFWYKPHPAGTACC